MTAVPTTTAQLLKFEELTRADVPFAGGKGANLGELTAAGLPVPVGFVVGAPAYAASCEETGLRGRLAGAGPHRLRAREGCARPGRRASRRPGCVRVGPPGDSRAYVLG
jgi:Pyruvate phosphate dikinase, AMP/ATP-binding domain